MFVVRFFGTSCALALALAHSSDCKELSVAFDSARATSALEEFPAAAANSKDSGYWSSAGNHVSGQRVAWTGRLSAAQDVAGVAINWAYAPGEVRILTSADGGNFEEASAWRSSGRSEVSFSEMVMFEKPHRAVSVAVVMRSPKPWGYFGINSIEALVVGGPSMLVVGGASGENCLVADGAAISVRDCLDAIASGDGSEVFSLTSSSEMVSNPSGKCMVAAGRKVVLQDCEAAAAAGDGRSVVRFSASGHLQFGKSCLAVSASGATLGSCQSAAEIDKVAVVAVPEFNAAPSAALRDAASMLQAVVDRQSRLLEQLRAGPCKLALAAANVSANLVSQNAASKGMDAAASAISRIDAQFGFDLSTAKALLASSKQIEGK